MTDERRHDERPSDAARPDLDDLAEEIREENPDPTTRREALELELMREGRSEEGAHIGRDALEDDADASTED